MPCDCCAYCCLLFFFCNTHTHNAIGNSSVVCHWQYGQGRIRRWWGQIVGSSSMNCGLLDYNWLSIGLILSIRVYDGRFQTQQWKLTWYIWPYEIIVWEVVDSVGVCSYACLPACNSLPSNLNCLLSYLPALLPACNTLLAACRPLPPPCRCQSCHR